MGNSCFGIRAQVILGKLGQRQCAPLCDLGRGPDGPTEQSEGAHGSRVGTRRLSPALVLDAQICSHVVITLCSVHMNSPVFTQTERLESGVTRTQVLSWDSPPPPSCCRAVTGLRLTLPGPVSSAAPHCHRQRLPDGHQWGPEQGCE